jgi:hypothetical protein
MHPRLPGWGLGFQVNDANDVAIIEHGGDIGGFSSLLVLIPEQNLGFFIVNHLEGANLRFEVKQAILDRYFPDRRPMRPPAKSTNSKQELQRFAGSYRPNIYCHSCSGPSNLPDFAVTVNDDGTLSGWDKKWTETEPLYFVSADGRERIGFKQDSAGRIVAASAGSWRVMEKVR